MARVVKSKSVRVRAEDARALLRLMHELHELPPEHERRISHFLDGLCPLLDSQLLIVTDLADCLPDRTPRMLGWMHGGKLDLSGLTRLRDYPADGDRYGPFNRIGCSGALPDGSYKRHDHVSDREHFRSDYYQDFCRTAGCDNVAVSLSRLGSAGRMVGISVCRSIGARRFGERECNLLELARSEFGWLLKRVAGPDAQHRGPGRIGELLLNPPGRQAVLLTPQARRVLSELLTGRSEKEIARTMFISRHTVHDYVKMIYRCYRVSSRAELLARLLPAPYVIGSTAGDALPRIEQ